MKTYEILVKGLGPIELDAEDIYEAMSKTRRFLANALVWPEGVEPFTATVTVSALTGESASAHMSVECCKAGAK